MTPFLLDAVDPLLADRLRKLAGRRGWSESEALRHAVERGLTALETEVPATLEDDESLALREAIAALERIPDAAFAAIGAVQGQGKAPDTDDTDKKR
jgi:hypothetical protein